MTEKMKEQGAPRVLSAGDKSVIFRTLNMLAYALGEHGHQWSEEQIAAWKKATRLTAEAMRPDADFDRALAEAARNSQ